MIKYKLRFELSNKILSGNKAANLNYSKLNQIKKSIPNQILQHPVEYVSY